MKIFDYDHLGGKNSWDYRIGDPEEEDGVEPLLITDQIIDMGTLLVLNKIAYSVICIHYTGGLLNKIPLWCLVDKLINQKVFIEQEEPEEVISESDMTCPFCGCKEESFELPDAEDEHTCTYCHSVFSYQREVTVEYSCQPIKKAIPLYIN